MFPNTATLTMILAAALALPACHAWSQEKVTFGTNWVAEAEHGGYYQAVADGTYKACGLDVTIVPGGPQVNNSALLIAGKLDFLMGGNLLEVLSAAKEGIPMRVVAADFQKDPQIFMTHPGRVKNFADMKTLPKIFVGDGGYITFYQWMMTADGFAAEKRVPYTFNAAPFIADKDSAQQGYVTSEPFAVKTEGGFEPDIFLLADNGWTTPATLIEAMQPTIDKKPDAVKCFVEGSAIGWANYLYGDPSKANAMIKAANPGMNDAQIAYSIQQLKKFGVVDSGLSIDKGIGAMSAESIQDFYDKMIKAKVVDAGLDVTKVYTLQYANTGAALAVKKKLMGK